MLSLRQIEVFRAVMVAGTVHGAAKLLHVSQPGLSRLLRHTEDRLGFALFERRRGRLAPTAEAERLFQEIQPIYRQIEQLEESTRRIARGETDALRIAASPSVGRFLVPAALARMSEGARRCRMHLDILSVDQVVDYLAWRRGEGVVTIFPIDHPMVVSERLTSGSLVCVLPPGHAFSSARSISVARLAGERLIGFETQTPHGALISSLFSTAGLEYRPAVHVRFAESACALVEMGLGVAIVDQFTPSGNVFPRLAIRPLTGSPEVGLYLNENANVARSAAYRSFQRALLSVIGEVAGSRGSSR